MKKLIIACLLAASLGLFAGCSKGSKSDESQQAPPPAPPGPPPSATHTN